MNQDFQKSAGALERELFLTALEKTPAERAAFLRQVCGKDSALRHRVEDLLNAQTEVGSFLETPALCQEEKALAPSALGPHGTDVILTGTGAPGDRIGRYKLLQRIGEGGCGVVYMAEQEEPVRRRVALKVIKLGMDTKSVVARFEAERQALALMDHPNIAKVLDGGATETGRPYFVMELVRGIRITEFCDENNLSTVDRLKLFIQVCQAIQHAHQKGIIHRDIKPSNILVTLHDGVPVPKVIDFGIAKATEQRLTEKTLFTEFHSFIGTPAYTSPEQAEMSGLDIDTRSDIYSLGVLLYELLIGQTPFDPDHLAQSSLDEMRRIIREEEPLRPSTRLSALGMADAVALSRTRRTAMPMLVEAVRGDIDWIVMKCLEKDRGQRYATTHDLALDVQRHLDREPVLARPPSNVYRLQKLLLRHRGAFAAAAVILVSVLAGIAMSTWQAVRATRAERQAQGAQAQEKQLRRQAESERERAEQEKAAARLNEYVADINLAQQSLDAGNYGRAVQLLEKHGTQPEESDLRGFEWRYLWQWSRGDSHEALPSQDGPVQSVAIAPGGDLAAFAVRDRSDRITVWSLRTRSMVVTLSLNRSAVSLAFSPDGEKLMAAGPNTVRIWNTRDWSESKTLRDCGGPAALSRDGKRLVTISREGVRVWDTSTWSDLGLFPEAFGPVAISPDGRTVATDTRSGLMLWPLDGQQPKILLADSTNLFSRAGPWFRGDRPIAFSPDGKLLVAARNTLSERGVFVLGIWETATGREDGVMPADVEHIEHAGMITSLAFSPDSRTLVTASMDHSIRFWNFPEREPLFALQGHLSEVWTVAFSPDGRSLISGSRDGDIKLWSTNPHRKEEILTGVRHPLAFAKNSERLAALTRDGSSVVFLNLASGTAESQFQIENPGENRRGRFNPFGSTATVSDDLRTLVYSLEDGTIKLWDTPTRTFTTFRASDNGVDLVVLSPDGQTLITRGRDWTLRRWDLRSGTNAVWRSEALRVLFTPDGTRVATLERGNVVKIWDAASLEPLAKLEVEEQPAYGLNAAFSTDGRTLAVGYQDDTIRLWDVSKGKLLGTCTGHKQGVRSIAFAPDGKTLATSSEDSTLKFWNVATQQELLTIRSLGTTLTGLMFSPDGRFLVGGSGVFSSGGGLRFIRAPTLEDIRQSNQRERRKG